MMTSFYGFLCPRRAKSFNGIRLYTAGLPVKLLRDLMAMPDTPDGNLARLQTFAEAAPAFICTDTDGGDEPGRMRDGCSVEGMEEWPADLLEEVFLWALKGEDGKEGRVPLP